MKPFTLKRPGGIPPKRYSDEQPKTACTRAPLSRISASSLVVGCLVRVVLAKFQQRHTLVGGQRDFNLCLPRGAYGSKLRLPLAPPLFLSQTSQRCSGQIKVHITIYRMGTEQPTELITEKHLHAFRTASS